MIRATRGLSGSTNFHDILILFLERVAGIEPARSAWEADRLPLHHTRPAMWRIVKSLQN